MSLFEICIDIEMSWPDIPEKLSLCIKLAVFFCLKRRSKSHKDCYWDCTTEFQHSKDEKTWRTAVMSLSGWENCPVILVVKLSVFIGTGEWARNTKTMEYRYCFRGLPGTGVGSCGLTLGYDRTRWPPARYRPFDRHSSWRPTSTLPAGE